MTFTSRAPQQLLKRTAVAVAIAAACSSAFALEPFTLSPAASGLAGANVTADNILVSDFSTVMFDGSGGFTETGFLSVSAFQLGGATLAMPALNSTYGLYFAFDGAGTATGTTGTFTSLNYTLYGYNGTASFGFSGNTPTETATGEVTLATGTLIDGGIFSGAGGFTGAGANLTFAVAPGAESFFVSPSPFYDIAIASFINSPSQIEAFDGGFRIRQGGGSVNFAMTPAVPEPETYALMLAGLGAVGFVARRRRSSKTA